MNQNLSPDAYDAIAGHVLVAVAVLAAVVIPAAFLARKAILRVVTEAARLWRSRAPLVSQPDRLPLAAITLAGAAIRARYLAQPVRTDEAATFLYYAFQPFLAGISIYGSPNNHLLNTLLVHVCYLLGGDVPALLRLPSFLAGVLIIPATYIAARALTDQRAAIVAAAFTAGLPALIDFSALARGYSMMTLAFLAALALAALRSDAIAVHVGIGIAIALGAFAVPVMLYAAAFLFAWMALERQWRGLAVAAVTSAVVTAILYLPVLAVSGVASLTSNPYVETQSGKSLLFDPSDGLFAMARFFGFGLRLPLALTLAVLAVIGLVRDRGRFAIALVAPLLIASVAVPYHRSWLFLLPLFAIAIGRTAAPLARFAPIIALLLAAYSVASDAPYDSAECGSFRDAEGTTLFLKSRLQPGDTVMATVPADVPLMYYFHRHGVPQTYLATRRGVHTYVVADRSVGQQPPAGGRIVRQTDSSIIMEKGPPGP